MSNTKKSITIIGPGAWGSALAKHLQEQQIMLIGNKNKPNLDLSFDYIYSNSLDDALTSDYIIIATPSKSVPKIIQHLIQAQYKKPILCASKGLAHIDHTSYLFHELPGLDNLNQPLGYLSGPTFAHELTQGVLTCAVVTGSHYNEWHSLLHRNHFHIYPCDDTIGVALCSLYKNIAAMLAGCCQPPILGENSRAILLSKAIAALTQTIQACSGNPKTAWGPAGLGDIILSGTSMASRNYQFGYNLAQNIQHPSITTESLANLTSLHQYLQKHNHNCDFVNLAHQIITTPSMCKEYIQIWLTH